jgi:predicted membrane protein
MKTKTKNLILAIITSVVAIFIPSLIFGKWVEGFVFFFCHWFIREQFSTQYHHIVPAMCRLITSIVFFFGVSFILPFGLSLFSAIPICYFISWIGYTKKQADYYERQCERLKEKYCNEKEDLLVKCRKAKLSERDTEIAVKYFYEKKTPKEIWLWICQHKIYEPIEWDCTYVLINRIGKKIQNIK